MDEVKGSCARVASRRLLPEHRYSTPSMPPAGLRSGSWCQVGWAATPCNVILMRAILTLDEGWHTVVKPIESRSS